MGILIRKEVPDDKISAEKRHSHGVEIEVLDDETCSSLMAYYILDYPKLWNGDIGE